MKPKTEAQKKSPIVQERIRAIAHLLARGEYHRPTTTQALALEWGVSEKRVENMASEAANLVRMCMGDDTQIKNELIATLRAIAIDCFERGRAEHPPGHAAAGSPKERNAYQWYNTAIQALDRVAGLTGANAPARVDIKTGHNLEDIEALAAAVNANRPQS